MFCSMVVYVDVGSRLQQIIYCLVAVREYSDRIVCIPYCVLMQIYLVMISHSNLSALSSSVSMTSSITPQLTTDNIGNLASGI